jgi:asparagine N-glycosylation enzyme membrane subunit Stt3
VGRKESDKKIASSAGEAPKREPLQNTDFYWYSGVLLAFLISFYLRGIIPIKNVFINGTVYFSSDGDAWYHMLLTKGVVINLQRLWFDPMTYFPHGTSVPYGPFNDWGMAIISLIFGLGHPSMHTIDTVGAFFPAVLGALVVIPVYFIGREIGGKPCGLISAFIIAVLPGGFFERTMLGFADHDAAELLLSTLTVMFFLMAIRTGKGLTFVSIQKDWSVFRRPLIFTLLAGVSLGLYLDAWQEGFLFEGIIISFVAVQSIVHYLMGKDIEYLSVSGSITLGIATLMILPFVKLYNGFSNYYYSLFQPTILILGIVFMLLIYLYLSFLGGLTDISSRQPLLESWYSALWQYRQSYHSLRHFCLVDLVYFHQRLVGPQRSVRYLPFYILAASSLWMAFRETSRAFQSSSRRSSWHL